MTTAQLVTMAFFGAAEVALAALLLVHAGTGAFEPALRRVTRVMLVGTVVVSVPGIASAWGRP